METKALLDYWGIRIALLMVGLSAMAFVISWLALAIKMAQVYGY
jgi:hypothetical protein